MDLDVRVAVSNQLNGKKNGNRGYVKCVVYCVDRLHVVGPEERPVEERVC
jgi:hypothetical protein